jgi:hypothetical protein
VIFHTIYHALAWTWGGDGTGGGSGTGYLIFSGPLPDITMLSLIYALISMTHQHNCHVKGCWRLGHPDPEHGWPGCKKHHSKAELIGSPTN